MTIEYLLCVRHNAVCFIYAYIYSVYPQNRPVGWYYLVPLYTLGRSNYQELSDLPEELRTKEYRVGLWFQSSFRQCCCLFKKQKKKKKEKSQAKDFQKHLHWTRIGFGNIYSFSCYSSRFCSFLPPSPLPPLSPKAFFFFFSAIRLALQSGKDVPLSETLCWQNDTPFSRSPDKAFWFECQCCEYD